MKIQLRWIAVNSVSDKFYLKCNKQICADMIIVDADTSIGNTLVLWNYSAEDIHSGHENEYHSTFEDTKQKVEFDIIQFFKRCFGDSSKIEIDDSTLVRRYNDEYGMYTVLDEMKPDIDG